MPKLHLKETPEERAERKWRKAQRAERKARRKAHLHRYADDAAPPRKRARTEEAQDGEHDDDDGWVPPAQSTKPDAEEIRAAEERIFRAKLFDAMEDDHAGHLDSVAAQFNRYGHVPRRWTPAGPDPAANTNEMTEDEYAEWVREGMWRRTHKAETEERERKKAERKARKEEERKAKEETARLERQRDVERKVRREVKERQRLREAWGYYETRWKAYTSGESQASRLKFRDVPWPVFSVPRVPDDLTPERISEFLLHDVDDAQKTRRERVREALLRWHPDKFEGKMGARLDAREREAVMDGVGIVARCLNSMMAA